MGLKAGWFVGLADCYVAIVLADNATFLLAVIRIAAFRLDSAIIANVNNRSCGLVGRASAPRSWGRGFESHLGQDFSTCLCPFRRTRSVRNYPTSASAKRATPKPHSLILYLPDNGFAVSHLTEFPLLNSITPFCFNLSFSCHIMKNMWKMVYIYIYIYINIYI